MFKSLLPNNAITAYKAVWGESVKIIVDEYVNGDDNSIVDGTMMTKRNLSDYLYRVGLKLIANYIDIYQKMDDDMIVAMYKSVQDEVSWADKGVSNGAIKHLTIDATLTYTARHYALVLIAKNRKIAVE